MNSSRRHILALLAAAGLTACLGSDDPADDVVVGPDDGSLPSGPFGSVPTPTGALITRWGTDPLAYGSYSYLAAGATPSDRDLLREDVGQRLFFAGEATSRAAPGTVHGALEEGRAAADRILSVANPEDRILVIGAGVAGLAAADALLAAGLDVRVIEGRDRVGGRLHTDTTLGVPIDLGAGWIHGDGSNPVADLAERAGVEQVITDLDDHVVYDADGESVDQTRLDAFEAELLDLDVEDADTIGEVADAAIEDLEEADAALARYLLTSAIEHEEAADIADLAAAVLEEGEEGEGDEIAFPGGYAGVLAPLLETVEVDLGRIVEYIYRDDTVAEVELADGEALVGERVLVTVPLGVLKEESIEFDPPLPEVKLGAIERLGMGLLNRVVLTFDEVFWDDAHVIGFYGNQPGAFVEWFDWSRVVGSPVLIGFNAGSVAAEMEDLDDDEVIEIALAALGTIYG